MLKKGQRLKSSRLQKRNAFIDSWLIMIKKPKHKSHIGFIHHCEVYTEKSMEKIFVLFLITSHLVGSFGEGKVVLYRICNICTYVGRYMVVSYSKWQN